MKNVSRHREQINNNETTSRAVAPGALAPSPALRASPGSEDIMTLKVKLIVIGDSDSVSDSDIDSDIDSESVIIGEVMVP